MSDIVTWLIDPLEYAFMQRALIVALACGLVCAVLSCWLTLLGWSLMGDAVSHAVLPGVVLSYVAGAPFAIGAFVFGAGAVALIGGLGYLAYRLYRGWSANRTQAAPAGGPAYALAGNTPRQP